MTNNTLSVGIAAALGAGLLWGLVFVTPLLLPDYPPALLTVGRYLAFGLITVPIAWWCRASLRLLTRHDWWQATKLSLIGNFVYYCALSAAIQLAGAPLPTLIIGTLPVVIAVASNLLDDASQQFAWRRLVLPLLLIVAGLLCVNADQLQRLASGELPTSGSRYLLGAGLAVLAMAAWTWYPIQNARWLRLHTQHSSVTWASAQGLVTLPLALVGAAVLLGYFELSGHSQFGFTKLGASPAEFWGVMLLVGFAASWLGTLLWNIASKNTPTALTSQLIVFETLAALGYAYLVYQRSPSPLEAAGIALLVLGVIAGVRALSVKRAGL